MTAPARDLWSLAPGGALIDPAELVVSLERAAATGDADFRTRLLIRDALEALAHRWGRDRIAEWLRGSSQGARLAEIWREPLGAPGFPSLERRVMEPTTARTILAYLRELGDRIDEPTRLYIGGSSSLIVAGLLSRQTEDIDVVDEVPPAIRSRHDVLDRLMAKHSLRLAHFQSHYLPTGWESRARSLDKFDELEVFLVDPYDVFVGKLFSSREKDEDHLAELAPQMQKETIRQRLKVAADLLGEPKPRKSAERNWYLLFGEPLPGGESGSSELP